MAKPGKRKKRSPGILDRPMVGKVLPPAHVPVLGGTPGDEERRAAQRHNRDRLALRRALFKHYAIDPKDPDAGLTLALRLARDFVPGFEIRSIAKRGQGRPQKWDVLRAARLLADVAGFTRRGS